MRVTVYCGAASGRDGEYKAAIEKLGEQIAAAGDELVYGGGGTGLMGAVARSVHGHGGKVHGIMPQILVDRELADDSITDDLEVVPDMDVRKRRLMESSDALVAFPGGAGTLEEIAQAYSWARIGLNAKPCIFYDFEGFWQLLRQQFERMAKDGFISADSLDKLLFTTDYDAIRRFVAAYEPPAARTNPESDSQ